jgi:hypothetical protein
MGFRGGAWLRDPATRGASRCGWRWRGRAFDAVRRRRRRLAAGGPLERGSGRVRGRRLWPLWGPLRTSGKRQRQTSSRIPPKERTTYPPPKIRSTATIPSPVGGIRGHRSSPSASPQPAGSARQLAGAPSRAVGAPPPRVWNRPPRRPLGTPTSSVTKGRRALAYSQKELSCPPSDKRLYQDDSAVLAGVSRGMPRSPATARL